MTRTEIYNAVKGNIVEFVVLGVIASSLIYSAQHFYKNSLIIEGILKAISENEQNITIIAQNIAKQKLKNGTFNEDDLSEIVRISSKSSISTRRLLRKGIDIDSANINQEDLNKKD